MSLSIDQLQVVSFDTTPEDGTVVIGPATPLPVCDSPFCAQTFNPPCPVAGTGAVAV
ncbi:MAG TPA: hypothetical protein VFJ16_16200 [Longimicrobium sp.]|nr:hypothetical protein [Longimicrobium sp.]